MTVRKICSTRVIGSGVLLALAGPGLAACDNDEYQDYRNQCAIEVGGEVEAVDCDDVDDGGGTVFVGGRSHPVIIYSYPASQPAPVVGQKMPAGGWRIGYKDAAGRARFGLPAGRVTNNTVKSNVIGKGGAPSGARGGSAGG